MRTAGRPGREGGTLLIYNPAAGGQGDREALARRVGDILSETGERLVLRPTDGPGHAAAIVADAIASGSATEFLVLGGDGTLNEAVTGAWRAGALGAAGPRLRFGVVPAGTANVIARDLGLPRDPLAAAARLRCSRTRPFDLGLSRTSQGERPFLLSAGVGLEAEVIADVDPRLKRAWGPLAVAWCGMRHAGRRDRGLVVSMETADDRRLEGLRPASLAIGNSRFYGGPLRLSHRASTEDGVLEVLLVTSTRLPLLLALGVVARLSEAAEAPGVRVVRARRLHVDAPAPVPVHVDAEPAGTTPATFTVSSGLLDLRAPG